MTAMNGTQIEKVTGERGFEAAAFTLGVAKEGNNRVRFAFWCPGENHCQLILYDKGKTAGKFSMSSLKKEGMEDVFFVTITGENLTERLQEMEYDFVVGGKHRVDPYATLVSGRERFGKKRGKLRGCFSFSDFDWADERWKRLDTGEMIIYQVHVRNFTRHASSQVQNPGTFDGMREKIPYLKKLGINTLFLLPVYEFDEKMKDEGGIDTERLNCWGYSAQAYYFAPKSGFSSESGRADVELKQLVKSLHQNGMNIILDFHFDGQSPSFITRCLRYYAIQYHIDGFRVNRDCMDVSILLEDPVLSHVVFAGEQWGGQGVKNPKLLEMNDGFLIDARRYLKSDEGQVRNFYYRFREQRRSARVVHYMNSHDGFTLRDLVSYDRKHNEANGENNVDGADFNYSWNCGAEGDTRRKAVLSLRKQQEKNAFVMLLLGMAVPMFLAGDEFGNTQKGNNNTYCQDNVTAWLDWRFLEKNSEIYNFVRKLISFRRSHALYHQIKDLKGMDTKRVGAPDVSYHGRTPWVADFSPYSREIGVMYEGAYFGGKSLYFAFNLYWESSDFSLPKMGPGKSWKLVLSTADECAELPSEGKFRVKPRSISVFEAVDTVRETKKKTVK